MKRIGWVGRWNNSARLDSRFLSSATADAGVRMTSLKSTGLSAVVFGVGIALTLGIAQAQNDRTSVAEEQKPVTVVKEESGAEVSSSTTSQDVTTSSNSVIAQPAQEVLPCGEMSFIMACAIERDTNAGMAAAAIPMEIVHNDHRCVKLLPGQPYSGRFCANFAGDCQGEYYIGETIDPVYKCMPQQGSTCTARLSFIKVQASPQKGVSEGKATAIQADPQPEYYDNREQVAARLTFTWELMSQVRIPVDWIRRYNESMKRYIDSESDILQAIAEGRAAPQGETLNSEAEDVLNKAYLDERISDKLFYTVDIYTIARTPSLTRFSVQGQLISLNEATVTDDPFITEYYLQGNRLIEVSHDTRSGQISHVKLAESGSEVLGIGSPFGEVMPEWLVLYAGVSPFRLYGAKPENWRLVSVSPEEWVFELPRRSTQPLKDQSGQESSQVLARAPYIRFHLNRRYQDALSRLEIRYGDSVVYTWRVLKYKMSSGVWFPAEIELNVESDSEVRQTIARLTGIHRTIHPLSIEIPKGTPVYDYRHLGLRLWTETMEVLDEGLTPSEWGEAHEKWLKPTNQYPKEDSSINKR